MDGLHLAVPDADGTRTVSAFATQSHTRYSDRGPVRSSHIMSNRKMPGLYSSVTAMFVL